MRPSKFWSIFVAKKLRNDETSNDSNGDQIQRSVKYVPDSCTSIVPQKLRDQMKIRGITHDSLAAKALTSRGEC